MSVEAMSWVFRNSPYNGDHLVIHLAIADVVNDVYDNEFWIKVSDLATKARCSERSIQYALRAMEKDGLILKVDSGGGRGKPSRYRFLMETVQDLHPLETVQTDAENGANDDIAPITNSKELKESVLPTSEAIRLRRAIYPSSFEAAWAAYPRKVEKQNAYAAWRKRVEDSKAEGVDRARRIDALRIAAENYASAMADEGRELAVMKHPATFWGPKNPWRDYYRRPRLEETAPHGDIIDTGQRKPGERDPFAPEGWYDGDEASGQ
jgi:hypothetical protein